MHVKSEKQEEQINQLQQRVSVLIREVQTSAAGSAQSLEAFNQKEDLLTKFSERIQQLESQTFQTTVFNLKQQLERFEIQFACDFDNAENKTVLAKQRVREPEDEIKAIQNSIGDKEVLEDIERLKQAQQAKTHVF